MMNGTMNPDDRVNRKRVLESELEVIRRQKSQVLQAIQQIAKKQKLGGPPSKAVAVTHEAKVDAEHRLHKENLRRMWGLCTKIIAELVKNTNVRLYFGEPVHRDKFPNYYDIIKQPRDLGTIRAHIDIGRYPDVNAFRDDVRLCFNNCRLFNPVGHQVRKFGDSASDQFEKKWEQRKIDEEWDTEMTRHRLALARFEAEAKPLPDKVKDVETEMQTLLAKVAARHAVPPPGPGREMTFEERRKLSHSLGQMPGEQLGRVTQIISDGPCADVLQGQDEYELDMDSLDSDTLWKIQAYVDSVNAEMDTKAARPGAMVGMPVDVEMEDVGAAAGGGAGGPAAVQQENNDSEEVGSKGNADSTGADPSKKAAGHANNVTTFVSATGPGAQPQIMRNTVQKKDVQLQNAGAWANLQAGTASPAAPATEGGGGSAPVEEGAPMEDEALWTEFAGREVQEQQAEAQKKALEEAELKRQAEEEAAAKRAAEEETAAAEKRKIEAAEAAKRAEEEQRAREAAELQHLTTVGAEDVDVEAMRQVGHGQDLTELGLVARQDDDEDDEDELEI